MWTERKCDGGHWRNLMARRVVLWRILRRMLRIVECETFLFWIEGGGGSVEQELGEN